MTAEDLLNGHLLLVPEDFRPLVDTVTALCGPPSAAELRGEAQARAAFRALRSGPLDAPGLSSRTLPLELRAANGSSRSRRSARARHRSTGSTRPPSRRAGARLGLVSGVAVVVIAAVVGFAYAGGVFSAPVNTPNVAGPSSSAGPSPSAPGSAGVPAGFGASQAPTDSPRSMATAGMGSASVPTPQALCQAWLKNPWRPSDKNWDEDDFDKLSTLAGGPQMVLFYCWKILPRDYWGTGPALHYPPNYSNGHWDWPPGGKPPAPGDGPAPGGDSGPGVGPQSRH